MRCPRCNEELPEGAGFCGECGFDVRAVNQPKITPTGVEKPLFCGECGARIENPEFSFCGRCGTRLKAVPAAEPDVMPAPEEAPAPVVRDEPASEPISVFEEVEELRIEMEDEPESDTPLEPVSVIRIDHAEEEDEEEEEPRRRWPLLLLLLLLLLGIGGWLLLGRGGKKPAPTPPASSSEPEQAESEPEDDRIAVPEMTGMSESEATALLEGLGLRVQVRCEAAEGVKEGTVLRQSVPADGLVNPNSLITLTVAEERRTPVPQLTGLSLDRAAELLEGLGIPYQVLKTETTESVPDTVLEQSLAADTPWDGKSKVMLVVSVRPKPAPTSTPKPTPTPKPTAAPTPTPTQWEVKITGSVSISVLNHPTVWYKVSGGEEGQSIELYLQISADSGTSYERISLGAKSNGSHSKTVTIKSSEKAGTTFTFSICDKSGKVYASTTCKKAF